MNVRELIEKLEKVDGNLTVAVEGCDCVRDGVGISLYDDETIVVRRERGELDHYDDEFEIL